MFPLKSMFPWVPLQDSLGHCLIVLNGVVDVGPNATEQPTLMPVKNKQYAIVFEYLVLDFIYGILVLGALIILIWHLDETHEWSSEFLRHWQNRCTPSSSNELLGLIS